VAGEKNEKKVAAPKVANKQKQAKKN